MLTDSTTPVVSIVVPAYQNARFIEQAVRSALGQTFADLEVVVADHSSNDGTAEILARIDDPRLRILPAVSRGGGAPRNWAYVTGAARGEFVKLLCGDDVLDPEILARQVAALRAHPEAVLAASRRRLIDTRGAILVGSRGLGRLNGLVPGESAVRELVRAGTNLLGEPACVLIRRSVLSSAGGWIAEQPYLIDQHTYMTVLEHGDLVAVPETLAAFRISSTQWSRALAREQSAQARAVHAAFRRRHPTAISRRDVLLGDLRATRTAWARRLAYLAWSRRLRDA